MIQFSNRINEYELVRCAYAHGERFACNLLAQAFSKGDMQPEQVSLRGLAEACYGKRWMHAAEDVLRGFGRGGVQLAEGQQLRNLQEAPDGQAVSSTAFSNLTGQLLISRMAPEFDKPELVWNQLVEVYQTNLKTELMPGIISEEQIDEVPEGAEYSAAGMEEVSLQTGRTKKRGKVLQITKEAIFFDKTGEILRKAARLAEGMALNRERRVIDMVIGSTDANIAYNRNNVSYATYGTSGLYINDLPARSLTDWRDIEALLNLFVEMTHPESGETILVRPKVLFVPPQLAGTAFRILNGTTESGTESTSTGRTASPLPARLMGIRAVSTALLWERLRLHLGLSNANAAASWFLLDPKAFLYRVNWALQVFQLAGPTTHAGFYSDVERAFKVSEMAECQVQSPWHTARAGTASA